MLGLTAIFTELRLDVLFNIVYEIWQKFSVDRRGETHRESSKKDDDCRRINSKVYNFFNI